jgi:hypothetical protein
MMSLLVVVFQTNSYSQDSTGVFITPNASFDFIILPSYINEDGGFEDPFDFNTNIYLVYGLDIGSHFPFGQLGTHFRYGQSLVPSRFDKEGGLNGEVRFYSFWNVGVNFQRLLWQNNSSRTFMFGIGYRTSANFHRLIGERSFDMPGPNDRIEDFQETLFGLEAGLNFRFGSRKEGRQNRVSLLWEPIYVRVMNKQAYAAGAHRIGININL